MNNFLKETWDEYIKILTSFIPKNYIEKFKKNKIKIILGIGIIFIIEICIGYYLYDSYYIN